MTVESGLDALVGLTIHNSDEVKKLRAVLRAIVDADDAGELTSDLIESARAMVTAASDGEKHGI